MPSRILKESVKYSDQIDQLTWFEEVVFYRLIISADDYGCLDGRPVLLRNELFPTRENITRKAVEEAILKLVNVGLLRSYKVSDKPYLFFPTWAKHQRIRNKHRKFPAPPEEADTEDRDGESTQSGNDQQVIDGHLSADCCQLTSNCPSESESNPNPNKNQNPSFCVESETASTPPPDPPVFSLPLNDKSEWPILREQIGQWQELYPAVDVMQQLRNMRGWLEANPRRRKTRNGISRFVTGWLSREQDRGWKPSNGRLEAKEQKSWMEIGAELEGEGEFF